MMFPMYHTWRYESSICLDDNDKMAAIDEDKEGKKNDVEIVVRNE